MLERAGAVRGSEVKTAVSIATVIAAIALAVWWEVSLWNECRETNSFWYCVRVLGK